MNPPSLKARHAKSVWIGIDPGQHGAIGALNERGEYLWVRDMPTIGQGRAGEFDILEICNIVEEVARSSDPRVLLEWPATRPDEAAESSKRFGVGLGILAGAFGMAGMVPQRVAPNKWKGRLGLKGKAHDPLAARQQAVDLAMQVIPNLPKTAVYGPRGGLLDGRAEALLIAWEGCTSGLAGLAALPLEMRLARVMFGGGRRQRHGIPF